MNYTEINKILHDLPSGTFEIELWIKSRSKSSTRTGSPYINWLLEDDNGTTIKCMQWDAANMLSDCNKVVGTVSLNEFKGSINLQARGEGSLIGKSDTSREDLINEGLKRNRERFESLVDCISNPFLKGMVQGIASQNPYYFEAPAAIRNHHNYLGGLLEHSCEVAELAIGGMNIVKNLNKDILITGGLLHDIGKIKMYKFVDQYKTQIEYDEYMSLLEHIPIGLMMVKKWFEENGKTKGDWAATFHILHIIASHHGRLEYGSPVSPRTLEAFTISQTDQWSAATNAINSSGNDRGMTADRIGMMNNQRAVVPEYINALMGDSRPLGGIRQVEEEVLGKLQKDPYEKEYLIEDTHSEPEESDNEVPSANEISLTYFDWKTKMGIEPENDNTEENNEVDNDVLELLNKIGTEYKGY